MPRCSAESEAGQREIPLIGCSTAGEIASDGPGDEGVVVVALGGPGFVARTAVARGVAVRLRDAGAEVAACAGTAPGHGHQALLLLSDGLAGDQTEIVRGAYSVMGAATPLVGGCAGDDLHMQRTRQLYGGEVLEDAVVGAWLASDAPLGIGVQHGWRRVGNPMLVTGSEGSRVLRLDDQPALDVYIERLQPPAEAQRSNEAFTNFALTHPLGLSRRSGEEVRFVAGADLEERSLNCIAAVPQGALVWMMEGDDDSVLAATDAACQEALAALRRTDADRHARVRLHRPAGRARRRGHQGGGGSHHRPRRRRPGRRVLHVRRDRPHARRQRVSQPDAGRPRARVRHGSR